tara:strand:+ start:464 stop:724 length:261 start_codon:yes stop_codon:yes gene_type:complete
MKNSHPVDRLKYIRAEIAELKEIEKELKDEIINGNCGMEGDDHIAAVQIISRKSFSVVLLRSLMGDDWVNKNAAVNEQVRLTIGDK